MAMRTIPAAGRWPQSDDRANNLCDQRALLLALDEAVSTFGFGGTIGFLVSGSFWKGSTVFGSRVQPSGGVGGSLNVQIGRAWPS